MNGKEESFEENMREKEGFSMEKENGGGRRVRRREEGRRKRKRRKEKIPTKREMERAAGDARRS